MKGSAKSVSGVRILPRSKPTTRSPALVSSRARILPVQPMPITTASTSLSRVTISDALGEIADRARLGAIALAAIGLDRGLVIRHQAGITQHLPPGQVAIAAVIGVGEEAFHHDREQRLEEFLRIESREFRLAALHRGERLA